MKAIHKLMVLLDRKQKLSMVYLLLLMLISAILEATSITMLFPIIQAIIQPEAVEKGITGWFYHLLGSNSISQFVITVMAIMIFAFVVKNIFLFYEQKKLYRFIYGNQFKTSERMMRNYLHRGYESYLKADTAVIQRNITADVGNMYHYALAFLQVISECIMFAAIAVMMIVSDVMMTVVISAAILITLYVVKKIIKPVVRQAGQDNQDYYSSQFKWISQTVNGIKEVKIGCREQYFVDQYIVYGKAYVSAIQKYNIYSNAPRLLIETVCIASMLGYLMVVLGTGGSLKDMTTVTAIFAVAAARLMPCANRINNQMTNLAYFEPFLMGVSDTLQDEVNKPESESNFFVPGESKLEIHKEVTLEDITYAYPGTDVMIFDHANMTVPIGAAVGIVGSSGAGKTTIVDVLLGLLKPAEGRILADNTNILDNYHGWLNNIGYIPQMIFMLDDTILKNVAFGIPEDKIDVEKVWKALKEAQLDEYIKGLPEGLNTSIGERGIRLSGGQRQRIGIARALYEDPEILILDEATSALDGETEAAIMESINHFQGKKTLIIIAHRLQTIEKCDMVFRVKNGKITRDR